MQRRILLSLILAITAAACAASSNAPTAPRSPRDFDVALYRQIARADGNQFVSPFSVSSAFTLLYPGARGATASAMAAAFGFDPSAAAQVAHARELARTLQANDAFTLANSAWVQRDFTPDPAYLRTIRDELGGAIETVDFRNAAPAAVERINAWAAQATRDRIRNLLSNVDPDTALVLANAVYFKADWTDRFHASDTIEAPFHAVSGARNANFMRQTTRVRYLENGDFQAVDLDYEAEGFSLAVFLPRERSSLSRFESSLTGARLDAWLHDLAVAEETGVFLVLPKVQMESRYELVDPLRALGLNRVFSPGAADLSGIAAGPPLAVGRVVHKTFLNIDEKGTEAAAATALEVIVTSAMIPAKTFAADRPFFIVLRHKPSNTILFMGRVAAP